MILITVAIGWREGVVVFVDHSDHDPAHDVRSWLMGYTINRVSLFALIFSIGILVDDAIVVVENIVRHWNMRGQRGLVETAVEAVAEVGNPTIVATLTIVAALLPMMFVSGMMGPYMSPIPANASMAMLFSFFVAVTITPWLLLEDRAKTVREGAGPDAHDHDDPGAMGRGYAKIARWLLTGRARSKVFLIAVGVLTLGSMSAFYFKAVRVKLLPFDNKSEVQVMVDLPRGSSLEETDRVLMAAAQRLRDLPELDLDPGLCGHVGAVQLQRPRAALLLPFQTRTRRSLGQPYAEGQTRPREPCDRARHPQAAGRPAAAGARLGQGRRDAAGPACACRRCSLRSTVRTPTRGANSPAKCARRSRRSISWSTSTTVSACAASACAMRSTRMRSSSTACRSRRSTTRSRALLGGVKIGYSQRGGGEKPVDITIALPRSSLTPGERLLTTPLPAGGTARQGANVELGDVVRVKRRGASFPIFRHNGRYAEMVTAEVAGRFEAPVYGMLAVEDEIAKIDFGATRQAGAQVSRPAASTIRSPTLLWDGEWEVTYVTFRDMGAAFIVALLGIYLLVVAQFGSFKLPLVILVPVPLTLIGIVFGHWMLNAAFTATSMIGFIALAGIIVRNSILLVDFIRRQQAAGVPLRRALIDAGSIRFKPIFLTAAAAVIGAAFILTDPIFQGLAISLVFGLISSTALTVLVIPAIYVWLRDDGRRSSGQAKLASSH